MPTYVYFISAGSNPIKIGVSDDPEGRLTSLQTAHYKRLHLLFVIACASREDAFKLGTMSSANCVNTPDRQMDTAHNMMIDRLTPAERRVATLVMAGLSAKQIAAATGNSVQATKNRLSRIYRKLDINGRTQLAVIIWEETEGKS